MKLIIDIPEEVYQAMKNSISLNSDQKGIAESAVYHGILSGTVLSECKAEDCISREDAKALFKDDVAAINELNNLLSVYPKSDKPSGKWIIKDGREEGYDIAGVKTWYIEIVCSECGFIKPAIEGHTWQYHYCPRCGAKMESEDKE